MTEIEVRRFLRLRNTVLRVSTEPAQGRPEIQRGRSAAKEPWKDKKYGYIPFAKLDRTEFMNDEVLPAFYASQWKFEKKQKDFVKKFHAEGRRQYEIRKSVQRVSQKLENVCSEKNPASAGKFLKSNYKLKPKDLTMLQNNLKTVEEIELSANKVRNVISNADSLLFSKTTSKLKTGKECAHRFHEKCFGTLRENEAMAREIKQTLLDLITKHNRLYKFTTKGNLKTNSRRVKEGRTKARTRKMKRMQVNIDKILSSISPSYRSGGVVTDLDLNKVQLLQLRQVKWIKAILRSEKLPKNVRSEFLQNLKAVVHKAIAEDLSKSEDDSRGRTDEESSDNESGDEEGSGEERSDESNDEDFEEQEMMTVEQAELMEQYVNGDL